MNWWPTHGKDVASRGVVCRDWPELLATRSLVLVNVATVIREVVR